MKIGIVFLTICLVLISCGEDKVDPVTLETPTEKELVKITNGRYTEYYPGGKQIKFEGEQDDQQRRHGKWVFYNEKGILISTTFYDHGKKHGHSIVNYPTGSLFYIGEYDQDQKVGVWKTYDESGNLDSEKDYGQIEN